MNPEAFSDLATARHSVRDFRPDPVPSQVLDAILDDARQAPSWSNTRPFMVALAAREMNMTPTQALWGATQGGARALRRDDVGAVKVGMRADLAVLDAPSHLHLCYRPGVPIAHALELEDMA